jgi:hypothetical protein
MKYCPICDERYDEEVIQFCTKDGTPLVEESEPRFTAMPSEEDEGDVGQETVIRRRDGVSETTPDRGERIVIPATQASREQQVRTRAAGAYYAPQPPPQNTGKVVALTILGTLAAIGFGALLFWMLQKPTPTNMNVNTNQPNINLNANGFDSNFNFNANVSMPTPININTNFNANIKTPTPTPTPKPSASPTASPIPTETPERTPTPRPTGTPRPSPTPTPRQGPRPPGNANGN